MKYPILNLTLLILLILCSNVLGVDLLTISIDHFSRTIVPKDTAIYWVEVVAVGNIEDTVQVKIEAIPSNPNLYIEPKDTAFTKTPILFKLRTTSKDTGLFKIAITTEVDGKDTTRQVWLHVVDATEERPVFILDAPPSGKLEKNIPQSLEGAIVPSISGYVDIFLESPQKNKDTLRAEADTMGLFHINHVLTEYGNWKAIATFHPNEGSDNPNSIESDSIEFIVKPRPVRLTVTIEDFHKSENMDSLRVIGQIATDFLDSTIINILIIDPDNDTIKVENVPLESKSGKFSVSFPKGNRGIYKVFASALFRNPLVSLKQIANDTKYASIDPMLIYKASPEKSDNIVIIEGVEVPISAIPVGYAVIVIGYSKQQYLGHLNMAYHLRDVLITRRGFRPQDIRLLTIIKNPHPSDLPINPITAKNAVVAVADTIKKFLKIHSNDPYRDYHRGLLFYWIGQASKDGIFKVGNSTFTKDSISTIYESALTDDNGDLLLKHYNDIVFMQIGDNSGYLLKMLELEKIGIIPPNYDKGKHSISSTHIPQAVDETNYQENFIIYCGKNTFSYYFCNKIASNNAVHEAFKHGWSSTTITTGTNPSEINPNVTANIFLEYDQISPSNFWEGKEIIKPGYDVGTGELEALIGEPIITSIVGSPQFNREGIVYVPIDNPNKYPIRQVILHLEPPNISQQPVQCFKLEPVDSAFLWKTKIDVFKYNGLYRSTVFVEQQSPRDHLDVTTSSLDVYNYIREDTIVTPPPPSPFWDPHFEVGWNNIDYNLKENTSHTGMVGINLLSTVSGRYEYLGFGITTNYDKTCVIFMPEATNLGMIGETLRINFIPDFWMYWGMGYDWRDIVSLDFSKLQQFIGVKMRLYFKTRK